MTWNPEYFSTIGYLGLTASAGAVLSWLFYLIKPARLIATLALSLVVAGWFGARLNSSQHVNKIQPDRTEELARRAAQEEARRKALIDSRGDEVADVRFAEDGASDFLDRAGMDEADLKYFESQGGFGKPDWKKEKKKRSGSREDDGLESAIGAGGEVIQGVSTEELGVEGGDESIVMAEADLVMANRLDLLNLKTTTVLVVVTLILFVFDYLRRANIPGKASFPLPLPSSWLTALTSAPPLVVSKKRNRKSARGELARLVKRGDSFIYLTDDPDRASRLPSWMRRFPIIGGREDLISVTERIDDDFVFESAWYGRSSFVIDSAARSRQVFNRILASLAERKVSRAKVSQTVHLVWDLETPMPEQLREEASSLARATGVSILLLRDAPYRPRPGKSPAAAVSAETPMTS